jgi:hypothetical protein
LNKQIEHGGTTYEIIELETCMPRALQFQEQNKHWHSHVLSPGCAHNPYPEKYAIILEDDTLGKVFIALSDEFPEVDKELVKMLHGDDILSAEARSPTPLTSPFLERLRDIDEREVPWHHHMNFPTCAFNPVKGKWAITVESDEGVFHDSFDDEPVDVLREVEVLYFRNLDKKIDHKH